MDKQYSFQLRLDFQKDRINPRLKGTVMGRKLHKKTMSAAIRSVHVGMDRMLALQKRKGNCDDYVVYPNEDEGVIIVTLINSDREKCEWTRERMLAESRGEIRAKWVKDLDRFKILADIGDVKEITD